MAQIETQRITPSIPTGLKFTALLLWRFLGSNKLGIRTGATTLAVIRPKIRGEFGKAVQNARVSPRCPNRPLEANKPHGAGPIGRRGNKSTRFGWHFQILPVFRGILRLGLSRPPISPINQRYFAPLHVADAPCSHLGGAKIATRRITPSICDGLKFTVSIFSHS